MQDNALRNCYATLIAGFVVGGFLVAAEAPGPVSAEQRRRGDGKPSHAGGNGRS